MVHSDCATRLVFSGDSRSYAANNGLLDVILGDYSFPKRGGLQGVTYTKLTKLATHAEVDGCNAVINDLIQEQLEPFSPLMASQLRKVVGELHDNVASHARGLGYSCAQVYTGSGDYRIEFAIADAGCGMLKNVQSVVPEINSACDAIQWCLQKGNTTAQNRKDEEWVQRLPEDARWNPFGDTVAVRSTENHHIGEGLWRLSELVRSVDGNLWIASGDGQYRCVSGKEQTAQNRFNWSGVAIEFELTVIPGRGPSLEQQQKLERLAERIGL